MFTLVSIVLICFGGWVFSLAFRKGYQRIGPVLMGAALVGLGFYILPVEKEERPDVYYRK